MYPKNVLEIKRDVGGEKRRRIKVEELVIASIFCISHLKNRVLFVTWGKFIRK